jgi:hypothetical protein
MLVVSINRKSGSSSLLMPYPCYRAVRQYWYSCRRHWPASTHTATVSRIDDPTREWVLLHPPVGNPLPKDEQPVTLELTTTTKYNK